MRREVGLPGLIIWDTIRGPKYPMQCVFEEDNQTCIRVLETGKSPKLRHLGRTHKICLRWLFEVFQGKDMCLRYCETKMMSADIFTKSSFTQGQTWRYACELINHLDFSHAFTNDTQEFQPVVLPPKVKFKMNTEKPKLDISILGSKKDANYRITEEDLHPLQLSHSGGNDDSLIKPNGKVTRVKKPKMKKKTECITESWNADW